MKVMFSPQVADHRSFSFFWHELGVRVRMSVVTTACLLQLRMVASVISSTRVPCLHFIVATVVAVPERAVLSASLQKLLREALSAQVVGSAGDEPPVANGTFFTCRL